VAGLRKLAWNSQSFDKPVERFEKSPGRRRCSSDRHLGSIWKSLGEHRCYLIWTGARISRIGRKNRGESKGMRVEKLGVNYVCSRRALFRLREMRARRSPG
jgi:hypothetical protein